MLTPCPPVSQTIKEETVLTKFIQNHPLRCVTCSTIVPAWRCTFYSYCFRYLLTCLNDSKRNFAAFQLWFTHNNLGGGDVLRQWNCETFLDGGNTSTPAYYSTFDSEGPIYGYEVLASLAFVLEHDKGGVRLLQETNHPATHQSNRLSMYRGRHLIQYE